MTILRGSDYSKHNGNNSISTDDDFVILRAGYGRNNEDYMFRKNVIKCNERGKPFGVYWFSYALTEKDAVNEAKYCINIIKSTLSYPLLPIYYDNEYDSRDYFLRKRGFKYTKEIYSTFANAFCSELERQGYYAGIYLNKDYYKNYLDSSIKNRYTLWLADYNCKGCIEDFNGKPSNVHMIQYTSKPWDLDVCKIDFPKIIVDNKLNGW